MESTTRTLVWLVQQNGVVGWWSLAAGATTGLVRARTKIGLANLTYNLRRYVFPETIAAPA